MQIAQRVMVGGYRRYGGPRHPCGGGALLLIKQASMMEATTGELLVRCGGAAYW